MGKRIAKLFRGDGYSSFISSVIAIITGLIAGYVILLLSNPSQSAKGFTTILSGGFAGGMRGVGNVFYYSVPIMMTGLGIGFAFKTGLFNIGGPGQYIIGAYLAILTAIKMDYLKGPFRWIIPIIFAILGGALWGVIPGALNAFFKVNIVIGTIMMNYIGMYLVNYLIRKTVYNSEKNSTQAIPKEATLPTAGLDNIFKFSSINSGIFIAIIVVIIIYFLLEKTSFGYQLKACGYNRDASKYAGINEKLSIILSMAISGALCSLGGALVYLSGSGKQIEVIDSLSSEGFTGISVALLGLSNPIGILFAALFISYITVAGFYMQSYGFVPEIIDIIISVIIYFSAFSMLIKSFINKRTATRNDDKKVVEQSG